MSKIRGGPVLESLLYKFVLLALQDIRQAKKLLSRRRKGDSKKMPPKSEKSKVQKKAATHPTYNEMVASAITTLKERSGTSRQKIIKYIGANYKVAPGFETHVKLALKRQVAKGILTQPKGTGASGSFKLAKVEKPPVKKPAPKKPASKPAAKPKTTKTTKKPAAAKTKKPAAKKATTAKPKSTAKPKKPATKATKPKSAKKPASKAAKPKPKKATGAKKTAKATKTPKSPKK